jgi:hypothetical protein
MRSVTPAPTRHPLVLAWAIGVLTLAGCSLDLDLPGAPTGPTVTAFSPTSAYAGELVRVTGSHFEADAPANTVSFALASARGVRWDGAELVVRVPADAGDGPIAVSSRDGTSAPSGATFGYRGLGEPRRGQVVSSESILHHPLRVHSAGGTTFVESQLYGSRDGAGNGLVKYGLGSTGPDPFVSATAAAPWRSLVIYSVDDAAGTTVTLVNQSLQTWRQVVLAGVQPWRVVPVRNASLPGGPKDLLVTFQTNALGEETVAAWALDDLLATPAVTAPAVGETPIQLATPEGPLVVASLTGAVDTGDGRVVAVASIVGQGDALGIVVIDFDSARSDYFFYPAAPRTIAASAADRYFQGLASAVQPATASPLIGFALDGGRVGLLDLAALTAPPIPGNVIVVGTYSSAPVVGIAMSVVTTPTAQVLAVATKPDDDLVIGVEGTGGGVAWGLPTRGARRVVVDGSSPWVVWVVNDEDNEAQVVNARTGRQVGRVSFDVAPTLTNAWAGPSTGLAYSPADPADPLTADELYLSAGNPAAVLVHPIGFGQQACAWRPASAAALVRDPASRAVWGATAGAPIAIADLSGIPPAPVMGAPDGEPYAAAFAGSDLVIGHDSGLTAVSGGTVTGTWSPAWSASPPLFYALGATPGGEVFAAGSWDYVDRVQLWPPDQITGTGAPVAEWLAADYVEWAAWLEDGLWVQHTDYSTWGVTHLEVSSGAFVETETVTPVDPIGYFVGTTPNRRALVRWEYRFGGGSAIRLFSADPATGFAETMYVPLEGTVVGATFDSTGERLYVVTQAPDRVVTID